MSRQQLTNAISRRVVISQEFTPSIVHGVDTEVCQVQSQVVDNLADTLGSPRPFAIKECVHRPRQTSELWVSFHEVNTDINVGFGKCQHFYHTSEREYFSYQVAPSQKPLSSTRPTGRDLAAVHTR